MDNQKTKINHNEMVSYINNYAEKLLKKNYTGLDIRLAMKDAMLEAISHRKKYINPKEKKPLF